MAFLETLERDNPLKDENLFLYTRGPKDAEIIIVGEAWGSEEASAQKPFIGPSGKELDRILGEAGLSNSKILFTNCIHRQPPQNEFTHFLVETKDKVSESHAFEGLKIKPPLRVGINSLYALIDKVRPRLIIAAGNIPLWALSNHAGISTTKGFKLPTGISSWRGSQTFSREIMGRRYPLLPIIHPAAILREWGFRQITVQDLRRAKRYLADGNWDAPNSTFQIHRPTYQQVIQRLRGWKLFLEGGILELAVDLETHKRRFISVVGMADDKVELCIPLIFKGEDSIKSYFQLHEEQTIFEELKIILEHPNVRIIGQNFIYDTEWFHRLYNIEAIVSFDTMVAHHLLFPGTPKRLDYLASLYCDHYCYWKDESGDWDNFPDNADRYWKYNCKDTRATFECARVLKSALKSQEMESLYNFQMENWILSRSLMLKGISFDSSLQKELRLSLMEEASAVSHYLLSAVPNDFQFAPSGKPWFDSPKQTAFLLYEVLGLTPIIHRVTKKPTTDDKALQELSEKTPWLSPLLDRLRHLRSLGVFTANFLDARASADGRMRCTFNIAHPETFRWSSNSNGFGEGTNLQNIPKGDI